jgi:hypothetical protein
MSEVENMPIRNLELKSASKVLSSTARVPIGGMVPAGMKRWVTFIMVDSLLIAAGEACAVHLCSVALSNPTLASAVAIGNRKYLMSWGATSVTDCNCGGLPYMSPTDGPDPDQPLFSIEGGNFLVAAATRTSGQIFIQYFDE